MYIWQNFLGFCLYLLTTFLIFKKKLRIICLFKIVNFIVASLKLQLYYIFVFFVIK